MQLHSHRFVKQMTPEFHHWRWNDLLFWQRLVLDIPPNHWLQQEMHGRACGQVIITTLDLMMVTLLHLFGMVPVGSMKTSFLPTR